jgi:hypothetical protein
VAVSGGDAGVAVQAQQADGQAAQRGHHTGRVSRPDQRFILLISHVADPVKPGFYLPVAADPGRQGGGTGAAVAGSAVAGNDVHDPGGLLAFLRTGTARGGSCAASPAAPGSPTVTPKYSGAAIKRCCGPGASGELSAQIEPLRARPLGHGAPLLWAPGLNGPMATGLNRACVNRSGGLDPGIRPVGAAGEGTRSRRRPVSGQ